MFVYGCKCVGRDWLVLILSLYLLYSQTHHPNQPHTATSSGNHQHAEKRNRLPTCNLLQKAGRSTCSRHQVYLGTCFVQRSFHVLPQTSSEMSINNLVMTNIAMENHHFYWENSLQMAIFSSYVSHCQRVDAPTIVGSYLNHCFDSSSRRSFSPTQLLEARNVVDPMPETKMLWV